MLPNLTEFGLVLLSFIGFYRVELGFTVFWGRVDRKWRC